MEYLLAIIVIYLIFKIGFPLYIGFTGKVTHYCKNCGSRIYPEKKVEGSFLIELILWLCFLIPGLIYSLWRMTSKHGICPVCKNTNLIPLNSPEAQKILNEQGANN